MIKCTKNGCKENIYIGESERSMKERIQEHIQYIKSENKSQATGYHFNQPGHSLHDMEVTGIEKYEIHRKGVQKRKGVLYYQKV